MFFLSITDYHEENSEKQPLSAIGPFKFILRSDSDNDRYEHMYEWEVPNSKLRVNIRNRLSDGTRPIGTQFVVEVRVFDPNCFPTEEGIMMAWHNFESKYTERNRGNMGFAPSIKRGV
jgi:protocatechuate 3,4-dioxygenase beta subunit